jgi:hypothetical protein
MDVWGRSSFSDKIASQLIEDGLLRPVMNTARQEWIILGNEDEPNPCQLCRSFVHFHEQGFRTPASDFFRGLLHHYGIETQNFNPNLICRLWFLSPYARAI